MAFCYIPNPLLPGGDYGPPSSPGAEGYNPEEALVYLQYARASFCTKDHILNWDCGSICKDVPVSAGDVRMLGPGLFFRVPGFVAVRPSKSSAASKGEAPVRCIVAFRGSVDPMNWFADMVFNKTSWPRISGDASWCSGCEVHEGFMKAYEELKGQLFAAIRELKCSVVAVTGHSLGAAVATMAALDLRAARHVRVEPVFLFGAPRVGNAAFAKAFDAAGASQKVSPPAWRVVHYHDPIPRLAPQSLGYQHVSREVYYYTTEEDVYKVCASEVEDPQCSSATPMCRCLTNGDDHVKYFNLTLKHSDLEENCTKQNSSLADENSSLVELDLLVDLHS